MSPIVSDSSVMLVLAFSDEDGTYARQVVKAIATGGVIVPTLFWFEVRNALLVGERRGRIDSQQTASFLGDLTALPIEVDNQPGDEILDLARQHSLTVYDAAYLALAIRRNASIATIDQALKNAAKNAGVMLWQKS